jgi:thioredoxin-related protein
MNMKDKYRDKNVVFLFVDVQESLETVRNFVESRGYADMDPLLDSEGIVSNKYNIRGIPKTYILDTKGNIIFSNEGYLEETALKAAVDSALEQK